MAENWIITPAADSEYIIVPASVDVETWQHGIVTGDGDWNSLASTANAILTDTAFVDGLATSAVLTMATIRQQVTDALSNIHLDHLLATSGADANIVTGAFITQLGTSSGDWSDFDKSVASLEAISDRLPAALVGGRMSSDMIAVSGDTIAADNMELDYDGTGYAKANSTMGLVTLATTVTTVTNQHTLAEINAEMVDVMKTDTLAEQGQAAPPTTPTFEEAVMYNYQALIHRVTVTATSKEFANNAGTVIWTKALSDDGTTYTEAESVSGA